MELGVPIREVPSIGSVFITLRSPQVRVELLLDLALTAKRNVLMIGPQGCGKTTVCKHFLQARG